MGIKSIVTDTAGQVNVNPRRVKIITYDGLAAVEAAGYLNQVTSTFAIYPTDIFDVIYDYLDATNSGTYGEFTPTIVNGVITLNSAGGSGITLPTIANHIAVFTNTTGDLADDAATAINGGNIQAGLSGTAGYVASFPATSAKGSLRLTAVANTGDTVTTLSNVAMGQASTISIPDPANAAGRLLVAATATPFVSGNLPIASGTGGLMVDSGVAPSALQTKASIYAAQTLQVGGFGPSITVVRTGTTANSVVVCNVLSSSNPVSVQTVEPTTNSFVVTLTGDPGASCFLSYILFFAPQP